MHDGDEDGSAFDEFVGEFIGCRHAANAELSTLLNGLINEKMIWAQV